MRSPFPGMDPFIEACGFWEDCHAKLIGEIERVLSVSVPERYIVLMGERSYVVLTTDGGRKEHQMQLDVAVATPPAPQEVLQPVGGPTVTEAPPAQSSPVAMRALVETEYRETFLEIRELHPDRKLITCIEILSASNKRFGTKGWYQYCRKRQAYLEGNAHLVEMDLLRGGRRMPMEDQWPNSPYYLLVARKEQAPACLVWPAHFMYPLPTIPVPLAPPDPDIPLAIQPLIEAVYARSRYDRLIDYSRRLRPRFNRAESAWWEQRLQEWRASR